MAPFKESTEFRSRRNPSLQLSFDDDELIIDGFAGGGGASTGIEMALGRKIDIAVNHDAEALAMHAVNHPETLHLCEDVWDVDIAKVVAGRKVGLAWYSPDCTHHSRAKGGKPRSNKLRGLAWVVWNWAQKIKPRVIIVENVPEFELWGDLLADGQPDKTKQGRIFKKWVGRMRQLDYQVEWRREKACDHGAPTIRERLVVVMRCDNKPIVWPDPTHAAKPTGKLKPYRTAAECIDWSLPCPSIFLDKEEARGLRIKRPLADATLRRIAKGVVRYVINAKQPFIVNLTHHGSDRNESLNQPFTTITAAHRGEKALVAAFLSSYYKSHTDDNGGDGRGSALPFPLPTQPTENRHALITGHIMKMRGENIGSGLDEPVHTISAGGLHHAHVSAFMVKYFGTDQDPRLEEPMHTITSKHRFGLVTVEIAGEPYYIADIGMRMLSPAELYKAQGFPDDYIFDHGIRQHKVTVGYKQATFDVDTITLTKTAQVRMVGNSVAPPMAEAIVRAQFAPSAVEVAA